jgi:hypothetical protein
MALIQSHVRFVLTVFATLAVVGIGRVVRAQDDVVVEEGQAAPVDMVVQIPRVDLVDQWLFGGQRGAVSHARNKLNSALMLRIDDIERSCGLTEAQKQKLQLAGTADIKRFFDRVDEIKRESKTYNDKILNQAIHPLANELQSGLFGDHSFFAKTMTRTLSAEQAAKLETFIHRQKLSRYRATVGWYVVHLNKSLGLSDDQRQRLVELLVNETRSPKKYNQGVQWFILNQALSIPESRIKPIFNEIQWRMFSRQLSQARGMEQWLKMNGVVADDEPGGGQPALAVTPAIPAGSTLTIKRAKLEEKPSEKKKE